MMVAVQAKAVNSVFTEVFRVKRKALPPVETYRVVTSADDPTAVEGI